MKLWIFSDLHYELQYVPYPTCEQAPDCDLILIAGDPNSAPELAETLEFLIRGYEKPIVYVPRNHEYYQDIDRWLLNDRLRSMETDRQTIKAVETLLLDWPKRFYCLDKEQIIIGDAWIIGATLCVDFEMYIATRSDLPQRTHETRGAPHDFRAIYMQNGKRFQPEDMLNLHHSDADYIRRKLSELFNGNTVVVTHHMPHPEYTSSLCGNESKLSIC